MVITMIMMLLCSTLAEGEAEQSVLSADSYSLKLTLNTTRCWNIPLSEKIGESEFYVNIIDERKLFQ